MSLSPTGAKILSSIGDNGEVEGHAAAMQRLAATKLVRRRPSGQWEVTEAGRAAIAAHRAAAGSGPRE
ncbi:hypothetical protein [Streptacidiphilus jiangxiensis]|uniref:Uncharacterized protein n=1 Tax=Streptacidiphilus jiangxiensis TaxID=235985 RepID=A0A1H8BKD4_STRJI|nr:hypothetical protein [Streptacidiphilus jiangxiensis]SEM83246.1 hypothetical protein SAMN05414137_1693 [Streptacidiphilus jiangxiensis]